MEKWYQTTFRRNLVDMHISEYEEEFFSKFDAKQYVANLKKAQVELAYIYTNNCLGVSLWPTKVGHQHKGLKGKDIVAELMQECEKNGIMPVLYCNYWSRYMFEQHPEWRTVTPDGQNSLTWFKPSDRYGICCMNSPFQQHMEAMIEELVSTYDTKGLWIDMAGAFHLCTCEHCKKRFKEETGYDIPQKIEWGDKVWSLFIKRRYDWIAESMERLTAAAKKVKPDIIVTHNSARYIQNHTRGLTERYYANPEFVSGDYNNGRPYHSFFSKFFYEMSKNKPAEYLCPVMVNLESHTVLRTENELLTQMFSAMANNVRFGFIDALDPIGTTGEVVYEQMSRIYDKHKKFESFLEANTYAIADVGLYCSLDCPVDEDENGKSVYSRIWDTRHIENTRECAVTLKKIGLPYKVITPKNLSDMSSVKLLVLCDVNTMTTAEQEAIRKFVEQGGSVYASGELATYNGEDYTKVERGALNDVFGVDMIGREDGTIYYVRPTVAALDTFGYFTENHPLSCNVRNDKGEVQRNYTVEAKEGATVLGYITYPYRNQENPKAFSSAISNPPWEKSNVPALVANTYGKGKTVYSSLPMERLKTVGQNKVFKNVLEGLLPTERTLTLNAPSCIEVTLLKQEKSGKLLLNVLNDPIMEENLPVYGVTVTVKCKPPKSVIDAESEAEIPFVYENGMLTVRVEKIINFKMFVIEE